MKISIIQSDIVWENPEVNLSYFEQKFFEIPKGTELVMLPEMFTTGFSMEPDLIAEDHNGKTVEWLINMSKLHGFVISGSIAIKEGGKFFNRLLWVDGNNVLYYNKRHLFRMGGENDSYSSGNKKLITEIRDFRFCNLICYDLRFPVWARNRNDYDVLIFTSNWPAPRQDVWRKLLMARAIENQAYVIGVNRIGVDGRNIPYTGNSMVIDYKGNVIAELEDNKEGIINAVLNYESLIDFKNKFPAWLDADDFIINL